MKFFDREDVCSSRGRARRTLRLISRKNSTACCPTPCLAKCTRSRGGWKVFKTTRGGRSAVISRDWRKITAWLPSTFLLVRKHSGSSAARLASRLPLLVPFHLQVRRDGPDEGVRPFSKVRAPRLSGVQQFGGLGELLPQTLRRNRPVVPDGRLVGPKGRK